MSTDLVVAILASTSLGAIASSIIAGAFTRRKLGADATEVITRAASGVVERLEAEVKRGVADRAKEVSEITRELTRVKAEWTKEREATRRVLQLHVAFDQLAIAKLAEAGINLGMEPPPLLPPIREQLD